jgi:hypothetical protein
MKENGIRIGEYDMGVVIRTATMVRPTPLETFVCADCGYFENFVADPAKLMEISLSWTKVAPPASAIDLDDL